MAHRLKLELPLAFSVLTGLPAVSANEAGAKPPQAVKRDARIERIKGIPGFKDVRVARQSNRPGAPLIIILPDQHGSPEVEREKLEKLHQALGMNVVGLEGWAGSEADEKRGFELLNAEVQLIRSVRRDVRFKAIPLEKADLQEKALRYMVAKYYMGHYMSRLALKAKVFDQEPTMIRIVEMQGHDAQRELGGTLAQLGVEVENKQEVIEYIRLSFKENGLDPDVVFEDRPGETLINKYLRLSNLLPFDKGMDELINVPRWFEGVNRLIAGMKQHKTSTAAMVFGSAHLTSLIEHLKKSGDFSIVIIHDGVKEYKPE